MPSYVCLMKLTDQGVKEIKDAPTRLQDGIKAMQKMGGQLKDFYAVLGEYDYVAIADWPNDEAGMCFALALASQGSVRTTILKAFNVADFTKVCKQVP